MNTTNAVLRLLSSIGRPDEAAFYLQRFLSQGGRGFCVLHIDAETIDTLEEALLFDLRVLTELGLYPVIVSDWLSASDTAQSEHHLHRLLVDAEIPARLFADAALSDLAQVVHTLQNDQAAYVAIISPDPASASADNHSWLSGLLNALSSSRFVVMRTEGGFMRSDRHISLVNLSLEEGALYADKSFSDHALLERLAELIRAGAHPLTISVTSPLNLLRELFTTKGAGTLIRKGGRFIEHLDWSAIDLDRARALIESSFNAKLRDGFFNDPVSLILLEENYRGVAVVKDTPVAPYLTKFAVERQAQGEGLGRDLWQELVQRVPMLFWRARHNNPIHSWYMQQCDGFLRAQNWLVFWNNVPTSRIQEALSFSLSQPQDFLLSS